MGKIKHNPTSRRIIWGERVMNMNGVRIYPAGNSPAVIYACNYLRDRGFEILKKPEMDATHLLLPAPAFEADLRIRGGGILEHILADLPEDVTVVGGNLTHPMLSGYRTMDLLKDPYYLAKNADITAHCAASLAAEKLPVTLSGCQTLIIGWGRIGKCLASLLRAMGATVTVAARKETDRAMLSALGYNCVSMEEITDRLGRYRLIVNTAPQNVLSAGQMSECMANCLKIDLASQKGMAGNDVIWAKGLPGKMAAESSGALIGQSFIRLMLKKEGM